MYLQVTPDTKPEPFDGGFETVEFSTILNLTDFHRDKLYVELSA